MITPRRKPAPSAGIREPDLGDIVASYAVRPFMVTRTLPLVNVFPQKLAAFVALVVTPAGCYLFEGLARVGENNGSARFRLIASDNDIDVEWIELDAAAHPPGILRGDESRPGAKEGVENNLATVCQVDQRILQHCGWFHSRMIL
jgi:hypothetical protein